MQGGKVIFLGLNPPNEEIQRKMKIPTQRDFLRFSELENALKGPEESLVPKMVQMHYFYHFGMYTSMYKQLIFVIKF